MTELCLKVIVFAGVLLMTTVSPVQSQFDYQESKFEMFPDYLLIDHASFRADDSSLVRLEIYYQVHNRGLTFNPGRNRYSASYELKVTIENDNGDVVETFTRDRQVVVALADEARTRIDHRTSQINTELVPGKYKVRFILKDRNSGRINNKELKIKLENLYHRKPKLSSIEFAQAFQLNADSGSVFGKNDMLVVPSVHRVYGGLDNDRVAYYYEVYPGSDELDKAIIETKVRHYRKGMLYRDTLHVALGDKPVRELREISLADFLPGIYELEISLRGRRNKQLAHRSQEFKVAWTQEGILRSDWKTTVRQLELFAEDVDVGDMAKLETYEERLVAFNQFWSERDPTDGTLENEAKVAFYYRVRVANERFGIMRVDGWRTDRGRIFIQYGEPDYLVEEPFAPDRRPYQVWHYTYISPNRQFLFIDENEDGDYRLQYPYDGLGRIGNF